MTPLTPSSWVDQAAIDTHHAGPMMTQLAALREKYDLHMRVERFIAEDLGTDEKLIRRRITMDYIVFHAQVKRSASA